MKQVNYVVERYGNSSMVQEVGLDNALGSLQLHWAKCSTTVGTIVCWMFYTHLVDLGKITAEGRKNTERMRKSGL